MQLNSIDGRLPADREASASTPLWFGEVRALLLTPIERHRSMRLSYALLPSCGHPSPTSPCWTADTAVFFSAQVVPGSESSRSFVVSNHTPLPLPFAWDLTALPAEMSDGPAEPSAVFDGSSNTGSIDAGRSSEAACASSAIPLGFSVVPASGMLQPGETIQFTCSFSPPSVRRWAAGAQLRVRGAGGGAAVLVADMRLEGRGQACRVQLEPALLRVPGTLTVGSFGTQNFTVNNTTSAPAHFSLRLGSSSGQVDAGCLQLQPSQGVVPPFSSCPVQLLVNAESAGSFRQQVLCDVAHGPQQQLMLSWNAEEAAAEVAGAAVVDFGLIRAGEEGCQELRLSNPSAAGAARYEVQALQATQVGGLPRGGGCRGLQQACLHAAVDCRLQTAAPVSKSLF